MMVMTLILMMIMAGDDGDDDDDDDDFSDYYLGVTLCFYVAVVAAVADIFSTLCSKENRNKIMIKPFYISQ